MSESALQPEEWRSALSARINEVRQAEAEVEQLKRSLAHISSAYVLVFDVDTEDEAVYIMDVEQQRGVVLAFELQHDAEEYARSLEALDLDSARVVHGSSETSVQALDLEVLVVSSREADFRVAMVLDGDLSIHTSAGGAAGSAVEGLGPLSSADGPASADELSSTGGLGDFISPWDFISPGWPLFNGMVPGQAADEEPPESVTIAVSMVPEDMYAGRSSSDFIDPAVDEMFVLVHDAGTMDAQYFSIAVNRTDCVACFKNEDTALGFCRDLLATGATLPVPRAVMVDDLREDVSSGGAGRDVCLVHSFAEMLAANDGDKVDGDTDGDGRDGAGADGASAELQSSFIITDSSGEVVGGMEGGCVSAGGCSVSTEAPLVREMLDRLFHAESDGLDDGV